MRKLGMLWAASVLLGSSLGLAQSGPDSVCEVNVSVPNPGGAKQFEEARKKHNEFHKAGKGQEPNRGLGSLDGALLGGVSDHRLRADLEGHGWA